MIQTTLFFILGFLSAGFLALMVAPAIWRRAVVLTRRRVEASLPLTVDEIRADKDSMRAGFAMSTRRLEMSVKSLSEKAAGQIVEINRNREEMKRLNEEGDAMRAAISELEARCAGLEDGLREREEQLQELGQELVERETQLEQRALEMERLGRMYDEASFNASSRQIEIVAQESKLEKLAGDIAALRAERKEADTHMHEVTAESQAAREALRIEQRKTATLEKKIERLMSSLSDREEKLERRERDLARLRGQGREKGGRDLAAAPEAEPALAGEDGRERLEKRLAALLRENKALRRKHDELQRSQAAGGDDERREAAVLREQINDLAADVVNLTAMLDGPDSPIRKALEATASPQGAGADGLVSLADRVRALREAAAGRD